MRKRIQLALLALATAGSMVRAGGQDNAAEEADRLAKLKTVVVTSTAGSDAVIAIPPATSVRISLLPPKTARDEGGSQLTSWVSREAAANGLESDGMKPWHIVIHFDRFDEDGDNVDGGIYEEYWAGPKMYKRVYETDHFKQTDYATNRGLYRTGEQRFPSRAELQIRDEVVDPFLEARRVAGFHERSTKRAFGNSQLDCVLMEGVHASSDPMQYCFEPDTPVLRYVRGNGWYQTVYNQIVSFQGRNVAQSVDVTDGGKRYLELRVQKLEALAGGDDSTFTPTADALGPLGDRVTGVTMQQIGPPVSPNWPDSLRNEHVKVDLDLVIGKDGHVISARATSGPPEAYKACEEAARKMVFKPYLILDTPVEVEQKIEFRFN